MLEYCELAEDVMISFRNIEEMIAKAQDHVWILTNQVLASTISYLSQAIERGAEFKLLMPKDFVPTKSIRELVNNPVFEKAARVRKLDCRFLDRVGAFLCLSEKEVATIGFPNTEGKFDYAGFKGTSDSVIEWANALFMHYWNEASSQIPNQLFGD
jgi:predicted transcriptional regulator